MKKKSTFGNNNKNKDSAIERIMHEKLKNK